MYSTAVSLKKKYTKSPCVNELTKFGARIKKKKKKKKKKRFSIANANEIIQKYFCRHKYMLYMMNKIKIFASTCLYKIHV